MRWTATFVIAAAMGLMADNDAPEMHKGVRGN